MQRWCVALQRKSGLLRIGPALLVVGLASAPGRGASADEKSEPALKIFTVSPHTDVIYNCPPGRQIYFVQAIIEHQTVPVILLTAEGKVIPDEVFTSAQGFRLDRAHEHPVRVMMTCGR